MIIREIRALANMDGFGLPCPISGVLFGGEDQAHKFIISREDGQAITGTVAVKFLRYADDVTVPLTGSIEDGAATVTLNESCYLRPGRFKLTMYVTESESTTAVYCCMGTVDRTDGQRTVDPGSEITLDVTDLINQIDEAVDSIPPTWTELSDEVDELKSALNYNDEMSRKFSGFTPIYFEDGCYYTTPEVGSASIRMTSQNYAGAKASVREGDVVTFLIQNTNGIDSTFPVACAYLDANDLVVEKFRMINGGTIVIPAGVSSVVINNRLAGMASGYYAYIGGTLASIVESLSLALKAMDVAKIPDGTDYNTLITPGNYRCATASSAYSMINGPDVLAHSLVVLNVGNTSWILQIAIVSSSQGVVIKGRIKNDRDIWFPDSTGDTKWVVLTNDQNIASQIAQYVNSEMMRVTRNLWTAGDQSFTGSKTINVNIPAGTYVFSADVVSRAEEDEAESNVARIEWMHEGATLITSTINRNCRGSVRVVFDSAVDRVKIYASNTSAHSSGVVSVWTKIQLEMGDYQSPYVPPYCLEDTPIVQPINLFEMKDVVIPGGSTWTYKFVRAYDDPRNLIVDTDAIFTSASENGYAIPMLKLYYSTSDRGTCAYAIGGRDQRKHRQARLPAWPNYNSDTYKNTMYVQFLVPVDVTLTIKKLTVRYDDKMTRPTESGLKIDTHGSFMYFPQHSYLAADAAQKCGATRFITIPKMSSDGVWFAYHDDTFDETTTVLRNNDGTEIVNSGYDGRRFNQIPWVGFLENLTISTENSYGAFDGTRLMKISDLFNLCNRTGMKPMFSVHPTPTAEEAESLYNLCKQYGVLPHLTLKPSNVTSFGVLLNKFGQDIESYGLICTRDAHADADVQALINTMTTANLDTSKIRCFIELWVDKATPEQVGMILDAGFYSSLAVYTHTDPAGYRQPYFSAADYAYWQSLGVSEYTENHNPSLGLGW